MEKFIEVQIGNQIDRYHLKDVSVDDFIDATIAPALKSKAQIRDISTEEFNTHPERKFSITFNIEDKYEVTHYTAKHLSEGLRKQWNKLIIEHNTHELFES